jgi:hypothetical protein
MIDNECFYNSKGKWDTLKNGCWKNLRGILNSWIWFMTLSKMQVKHLSSHTCQSSYYKSLFDQDDEFIQKYDSPEVKRVKYEIQEQSRRAETLKRDFEKAQEQIIQIQKIQNDTEERMTELALLVEAKVKNIKSSFMSRSKSRSVNTSLEETLDKN